jgi:hypothetical protein
MNKHKDQNYHHGPDCETYEVVGGGAIIVIVLMVIGLVMGIWHSHHAPTDQRIKVSMPLLPANRP